MPGRGCVGGPAARRVTRDSMSELLSHRADPRRRFELLGRLAQLINEHPPVQELARFVYACLRELVPVDAFSVTRALPAGWGMAIVLAFRDGIEEAIDVLPPGEDERALSRPGHAHGRTLQSHLVCRVEAGGVVLGSIEMAAYRPDAYPMEERAFVQLIADQSAVVFERALQREAAGGTDVPAVRGAAVPELTAVTRILGAISAGIAEQADPAALYVQILREAGTLIPYQHASIMLFADSGATVGATVGEVLPQPGEFYTGQRVWREYRVLDYTARLQDPAVARAFAQAGVHDFLSLPLLVDGVVAGRLTFADTQAQRYQSYHRQLGTLLAERAAQVARMVQMQTAHQMAQARAAQLDTLRQDFVATVSHELRTPLTGILGYMELLLNRWTSLDDERRRGMLQRAQSSAVRLEHLVTDLLLFSNVEHKELQLQIIGLPLDSLIERAVDDMRTKYRGQSIRVRPSGTQTVVLADAQRAVQVISNLLDNAIKYSPEGRPVNVRWHARRREVEVIVRDFGPGIRTEDLPRLFTRFGTLGHLPRPGQVGTGIGLYVCKKLLDAMGGRIWVTSGGRGRGSIFHFTLPNGAGRG